MKRERTYGPHSRLPLSKAAELRGIAPTKVAAAMDEYVQTRGERGLKHVEEPSESDGRRNRWTTHRWLDAWEDHLADAMIAAKTKRRVTKRTDDIIDENGLVTIPTKEYLKRRRA